ncbi:hypothetical protein [Undibacterium sp. TS12]|uniref:hypothetical protein n=1 Tax=Undibacterium sp. TS12 TaxID=2908202 RepID=UPI001F4C52E2|nr:hypothetical protein [Undibacterium sp. TS12]MCH8620435.1 hypothetical protein [Undibacterium sp. TS12]
MKAEVKDMCPVRQGKAQNTAIAGLSRVFATPPWPPRTWQALRFLLLQSTIYTSAWTGVSRLPWLHALGLWPQGHTWGGGGHFEANRQICLAVGHLAQPHPEHIPHGLDVFSGGGQRQLISHEVAGAEWSGRDQNRRLIFAADGKLHWQRDDGTVQVLADFNGDKPDPREAPAWARRPLTG